ncbi:MAG: 6-bladed beta-propeller [Balneolaceae bacterium]|nr:6-bladed beta-propeller [Balneolaceae bacterium]
MVMELSPMRSLPIAVILCTCLALLSCEMGTSPVPTNTQKVPAYIDSLDNVDIVSIREEGLDTAEIEKVGIYQSNEEVFIKGYPGEVMVDMKGQVYIEAFVPGEAGIYVFDSDGKYVTTIGRHGKGPGEFLTLAALNLKNGRLYIYDAHQEKISAFSTDTFELVYEETIKRDSLESKDLLAMQPRNELFIKEDSSFVMNFFRAVNSNEYRNIHYLAISSRGQIKPQKLITVKRSTIYEPATSHNSGGYFRVARTLPFSRGSLVALSSNGTFYTNWNDDFLIKEYAPDGSYRRAYYYPYVRSELSVSEIEVGDGMRSLIDDNRDVLPDTWPAVHTIETDDQDRLWISTITESDSTFQWWVLNGHGKLVARFRWKGSRDDRSGMLKPMITIHNNHIYTRKLDFRNEVYQIIKYRVSFKPHPHFQPRR